MPIFKSTFNILKITDEDELFDPNWMDSDKLFLPPTKKWDYSRELSIEDIDIWEVIYERGGGIGLYAAWSPYAEFYMICLGVDYKTGFVKNNKFYQDRIIETYYGKGALDMVIKKCKYLNIPVKLNRIWVDEDDMHLYS